MDKLQPLSMYCINPRFFQGNTHFNFTVFATGAESGGENYDWKASFLRVRQENGLQ